MEILSRRDPEKWWEGRFQTKNPYERGMDISWNNATNYFKTENCSKSWDNHMHDNPGELSILTVWWEFRTHSYMLKKLNTQAL